MNKVLLACTAAVSINLYLLGSFTAQAVPSNAPVIGEFGRDELKVEVTCGIYLEKPNRGNSEYIWVLVYDLDEVAQMKLDNRIILLKPTKADVFSGKRISLSFSSQDRLTNVKIDLRKNRATSDESYRVSGTIKLRKNGKEVVIQVKGEAGC